LPKESQTVKLGYWAQELTPEPIRVSENGPSLPKPNPSNYECCLARRSSGAGDLAYCKILVAMHMRRQLSALLIVTFALVHRSDESFAKETALKDHTATVVSLAGPEYRDKVEDFLSASPKTATGLSIDAMLATNAINRIDRRQEYVARSSFFEVFSHIASNTQRKPEDRTYAIRKLERLSSADSDFVKKVIDTLGPLSDEADGSVQRTAKAVLESLKKLPRSISPRDTIVNLNEALAEGDSAAAMQLFHQIGDLSRLRKNLPKFKPFGAIVDSENILDLSIVVVKSGPDIDPICLIKIDGNWKICKDITEFTLPVSSHREASSMVAAMDALQTWFDLRKKQLLAVDKPSR
jgi:hypothetical protein